MSALTHELESQLRILHADTATMVHELVFHPTRKWRFDFAWPERMFAVEVEGGLYSKNSGGHNRGKYMEETYDKINEAQMLGWRIFHFGPNQIASWKAADTIVRALKIFRGTDAGKARA